MSITTAQPKVQTEKSLLWILLHIDFLDEGRDNKEMQVIAKSFMKNGDHKK